MEKHDPASQENIDRVTQNFFGIGADSASQKQAIRQFLLGALGCAFLVPALFYVRFGEIDGFGWGVTVFFVAYCLLAAVGLYLRPRTEYHTQVEAKGDWLDRIGAFWLVSCAFGPFLGWLIVTVFPLTVTTWRWLYILRIVFAAIVPIVTAIPLTRYVRQGKSQWIMIMLLVSITTLPILSVVNVSKDVVGGSVVRQQDEGDEYPELYLRHTERFLRGAK